MNWNGKISVKPRTEANEDLPFIYDEPKKAESQSKLPEVPTKSFYLKLAGVTYEGRQQNVRRLREGQELQLIPEPENPYDSQAVHVRTMDGTDLGFIPRANNSEIFRNLYYNNGIYKVKVSAVTTGDALEGNLGVNIHIDYYAYKTDENWRCR